MKNCKYCTYSHIMGGFMWCKKDCDSELEDDCEEFKEYTDEDAYNDEYNYKEQRAHDDY